MNKFTWFLATASNVFPIEIPLTQRAKYKSSDFTEGNLLLRTVRFWGIPQSPDSAKSIDYFWQATIAQPSRVDSNFNDSLKRAVQETT